MKMTTILRIGAALAFALPMVACSDDSNDDGTTEGTGGSMLGEDAAMATTDMIHIPLCIPGEDHMHTDPDADAGMMEEADHDHTTCGLQENCTDVLELAEGLTVDGHDGNYTVVIKTHTSLGAMGNHWMADILDADGEKVTDVKLVLTTWSVDCMHYGPNPPELVEADENGMYMLMPVTAHGGPWEVRLLVTDGDAPTEVEAGTVIDHNH